MYEKGIWADLAVGGQMRVWVGRIHNRLCLKYPMSHNVSFTTIYGVGRR